MKLLINTSDSYYLEIKLQKNNKVLDSKRISAPHQQSEKLLANIDLLISDNSASKDQLTEIRVVVEGDSFTGLRIGVVTANALGYGLGIPVKPVNKKENLKPSCYIKKKDFDLAAPEYNSAPNITFKKS